MKRGDVVTVVLPGAFGKPRPALVIQSDLFADHPSVLDIRRQNMIELLMYKALFELSSDRADFVSRLFSRKRPAGLNANSSAEMIFRAFDAVPSDPQLYKETLQKPSRMFS